MMGSYYAVLGLAGACLGSCISTVAIRSIRRERLVGRSHCDGCQAPLNALETLPILAFIGLKGRCRRCACEISPFHFSAEIAGVAIVLSALWVAPSSQGLLLILLGFLLVALACIDLKIFILPNPLVALVAVISGGLALNRSLVSLAVGLFCAVLVLALMELTRRCFRSIRKKDGLGQGDIKLVAALALWLGSDVALMVVVASLLALASFPFLHEKRRIAFGPFIALAAWGVGLCRMGGLWPALA